MKPPIIIDENGSLDFFKSVDDAERYLEPIDVRNQEYIAYDSEGRRLELRVEEEVCAGLLGLGRSTTERVRITQLEEVPTHAEELKKTLRASLQKLGVPLESLHSLCDLVTASTQRMGFS
jgi:hypothetical protein